MCIVALGLIAPRSSEARLEPYYVVNGLSFGQIKPRILFVLDTSGSMSWRAQATPKVCQWDSCEDAGDSQRSRIDAARDAIHTIVENIGDGANFGFMTFDQLPPPSSNGSIPSKCNSTDRFRKIYDANGAYLYGNGDNTNIVSSRQQWQLCGDNRPYAYLRYDDLGRNISVANKQSALPSSPMLRGSARSHADNASRKVQFFPEFLGVRINLDHNNADEQAIIALSRGDYGGPSGNNMSTTQRNNISGKDFYYWPYVDGFPGYSQWDAWWLDSWGYTYLGIAGHVAEDNSLNEAALYGPFYLESAQGQANAGPASMDAARQKVLDLTNDFAYGGVDVRGGTPWEAVIGPVTASPPSSNGPFSHTTVASYLKFAKNLSPTDACVPTATILVTDGDPDCTGTGNGSCSGLHNRLDALRTELDSLVYVVGFFVNTAELNKMACAGAGGCPSNGTCSNPCGGTPFKGWDTCYDPDNHGSECAWVANSAEDLALKLGTIVNGILDLDLGSGPGTSATEIGIGNGGKSGDGDIYNTSVSAFTEWPEWFGHVERAPCTDMVDVGGTQVLADYCIDNGVYDFPEANFGPCPRSRTWDAGQCLQLTTPSSRRLYMNDASNNLIQINQTGTTKATSDFIAQLNSGDLGIPGAPFSSTRADQIVAFILGVGWDEDWKLPGLANSAPILIRRIPPVEDEFEPSVGIRDPHCSGRVLQAGREVHDTLVDFATDAWDETKMLSAPSDHFEYQEAILIGDDLGVLHALQYDSGNELFGFMPRYLLPNAVESEAYGGEAMGQPENLDDHVYGVAATANQAWVYDEDLNSGNGGWRHIVIIGSGIGENHYSVLDVSHMSPNSPKGPLEVLWTTFDPALRTTYEKYLGETWARPAIIYHVPDEEFDTVGGVPEAIPEAKVVMASGYPDATPTNSLQGRVLAVADALDGTIEDWAQLPTSSVPVYESTYGAVVDTAVASHCISRYWAEAQETYIVDPAGRLFRWDLARETNHAADFGGKWGTNGGTAKEAFTFRACQGTGSTCSISSSGKAEPFTLPVAVVANNRIDEPFLQEDLIDPKQRDRLLLAFASGNLYDTAVDGGDEDNDFHSSLYVVADDHLADQTKGFDIPNGGGRTTPGTHRSFARVVLSDLTYERVFRPFPTSPEYTDTGNFTKAARPVSAPIIKVAKAIEYVDPQNPDLGTRVIEGVETYSIEFKVYQPSILDCDARFYDKDSGEWYTDPGSTYTIRMTLSSRDGEPFDLIDGGGVTIPNGSNSGAGLVMGAVEQVRDGDCADGTCGPAQGTPSITPCDPNNNPLGAPTRGARGMGYSEVRGFTPYER